MKILADQIKKNPAELETELDGSLGTVSGGGPAANTVDTDTSNFDALLSAADTNAQLALETIDDKALDKTKFTATAHGSGAVSIDFADGFFHKITTTGNITSWSLTNPTAGEDYIIEILYGGVHTVTTLPASVIWSDGIAPTFTSVNAKRDLINLFYDGTDYLGSVSLNY